MGEQHVRLTMVTRRLGTSLAVLLAAFAGFAQSPPSAIRRGGAITLKVESFEDTQKALFDLAKAHKGNVIDRQSQATEKGRHHGWLRIQLPVQEMDAFLTEAKASGKLYGENLTQEDISGQIGDLGARKVRLSEHRERLGAMLGNARRLRGSDLLYVQERLFRASVDQDTLGQQQDDLRRSATSSSVIVTLFEPDPLQKGPRGPLGHISAAFQDAGKNVAKGLLGSLTGLAQLVVYGLLAFLLWVVFRSPLRKLGAWLRSWLSTPTPTP
jgi:hypothetical protein